jgi:hypothetical protein
VSRIGTIFHYYEDMSKGLPNPGNSAGGPLWHALQHHSGRTQLPSASYCRPTADGPVQAGRVWTPRGCKQNV